jgi:hypothetical protein
MTGWNTVTTVRHIPDDELHGYLDQALSRSQAAEIELHLARCSRCQVLRDESARLRDRTTALLAEIGPPVIVPPAYETLRTRAAQRTLVRRRWFVAATWAASLAGAVLLGWTLRTPGSGGSPGDSSASRGAPAPTPTVTLQSAPPEQRPAAEAAAVEAAPTRLMRISPASSRAEAPLRFASLVEADPPEFLPGQGRGITTVSGAGDLPDLIAQPVGTEPGLQGLWRTVVPDSSGLLRSVDIPLVPGLPVVQMRVQPGANGPDVTAVDQLLESGELVRTLAGPTLRVAALVAAGATDEVTVDRLGGTTDRVTVTIQQGDRMVAVTGPSPALHSLLNRVNARRRY